MKLIELRAILTDLCYEGHADKEIVVQDGQCSNCDIQPQILLEDNKVILKIDSNFST